MSRRFVRTTTIAVMTSLALLAGCGGGDDSSQPASATAFNAEDVSFAQNMALHHTQAVKMAKLAATRAKDPAVKKLAAQIAAAQAPELETLRGFLRAWGQPLMAGMGDAGMDESAMTLEEMATSMSGDMEGMASEADLAKLEAAKGAAFDRLFLKLMLAHHRGALTMAGAEQSGGAAADAKALASKIQADQSDEIKRMQRLQGSGADRPSGAR